MQTRHAVEGLRNSRDFIQLPSFLGEAISTRKKVLYCLNTMRCFQNTVAPSEARLCVFRMIVKLAYGDFEQCLHETRNVSRPLVKQFSLGAI